MNSQTQNTLPPALAPMDYSSMPGEFCKKWENFLTAMTAQVKFINAYWYGLNRYFTDFNAPSYKALIAFYDEEKDRWFSRTPLQNLNDYISLFEFNLRIAGKGANSALDFLSYAHFHFFQRYLSALNDSLLDPKSNSFTRFLSQEAKLMEKVAYVYPAAIKEVEDQFGFHFDDERYLLAAETDRFYLYQVLPWHKGIDVRKNGKPIIIIPPAVLGANILAFLPNEDKSYVHAFANQGIPTYIRITKDIQKHPAVQQMSGEDDARDTRFFCEQLKQKHGRKVTLNGYCQGGFIALLDILSGQLDNLVDTLISSVSPIDGSRSKSLVEYIKLLPQRFRSLGYATKKLPNGNRVVDGDIMSWVYKLKSIESENPLFSLYRDLMMLRNKNSQPGKVSKTAAAINHWLIYDRNDLPLKITQMSYLSYTNPISADGTLPVRLFDRKLNLKRLTEKKINYFICYAERDTLVDRESALAPLDFVEAEVMQFPKGHGAIATSWSKPTSAFALDKRFDEKRRGPVRYQLDLEKEELGREAKAAEAKQ